MYDEKLYVEDEESGEYHLQDVERFVGTEHFKVVVHLAFGFQNSVVDHFYSLREEIVDFLSAHVWSTLSSLDPIKSEPSLWFFNPQNHASDDRSRADGWWNFANQEDAAKSFVSDPIELSEPDWTGIRYLVSHEFKIIEKSIELENIAKCNYPDLVNINKTRSLSFKGSRLDGSLEKLTLTLNRWEEKMCTYLLDRGFIVSLEPKIFFPDREVQNYREPDLLVFHMGRVIALEIDDRSHLVKNLFTEDGKRRIEANEEKWTRDRLIDKLFLLNGIPVLRVWYDEVDKHPERVMTEVIRLFDSLGGQRMNYS